MATFDSCGLQKVGKLGKGAYSSVYTVKDEKGELKALKLDTEQGEQQERLGITTLTEIDVLARLRHPNLMYTDRIITTQDCDIRGLGLLLPLGSTTLEQRMVNQAYSVPERLGHVFNILDGVAFLHSQSILHLDLKPSNIILTAIDKGVAMVSDFGLSTYITNGYVKSDRESITLSYRPPELLTAGPWIYRESADIWSIGIIILHLFAGLKNIYPPGTEWRNMGEVAKLYTSMFITDRQATFDRCLGGLPKEYKAGIYNLADQCLEINPEKRPSAAKLLKHELFSCLTPSSGGLTFIPNLPPKTDPIVRETVKYISAIAYAAYPDITVEALFLAFDIGYRAIGPFVTIKLGSLTLALVSLWMAVKLVDNSLYPPAQDIEAACRTLLGDSCEAAKEYHKHESLVLHELQGCLYRQYLYHGAIDAIQLTLSYKHIVLDPSVYYIVDIPAWYAINKPTPNANRKESLKIKQFIKV